MTTNLSPANEPLDEPDFSRPQPPESTVTWHFTAPASQPRNGRLHDLKTLQYPSTQVLELTGDFAARHVTTALFWRLCKDRHHDGKRNLTRLVFPGNVPNAVRDFATSLCSLVTVDLKKDWKDKLPVDFVAALDFYKSPDRSTPDRNTPGPNTSTPGSELIDTEVGALVHRMKYWADDPATQDAARAQLAQRLATAITANPVLAAARTLAVVPGHNADGNSHGERLAADVAALLPQLDVVTINAAPRDARKGEDRGSLTGTMSLATPVRGQCLVIDDVVRSGETFLEAARAARAAGASEVYALACAKTIRS